MPQIYLICLTGDGAAEARRGRCKVLEMVDEVIMRNRTGSV